MTTISLQNNALRITFSPIGAELQAITNLQTGQEYLWNGNPTFWNRRAPVLFPIVGKLKNDTYIYQNQAYTLGQHGFARSKTFELIASSDTSVAFRLTDDAETRISYPFAFSLIIRYTLTENRLTTAYEVSNPAAESDLLFSIGAHPGFICPMLPEEQYSDYYLEFSASETALRQHIEAGLRTGETESVLENAQRIALHKGIFAKDAFIFEGLKSRTISLRSVHGTHGIALHAEGFPYMGIWAKANPDGDFVCIEPWHGIADSISASGNLEEKEGIIRLQPQKAFTCHFDIEILL